MLEILEKDPLIHGLAAELSRAQIPGSPVPSLCLERSGQGGLGPLLALLHRRTGRPFLYIGRSEEKSRALFADCSFFTGEARFLPQRHQALLEERGLEGESAAILQDLLTGKKLPVFSTLSSVLFPVPSPTEFTRQTLQLQTGAPVDLAGLVKTLEEWEFRRVPLVAAPGEYAVRGGIIDLYPPAGPSPYRLEWGGDLLESIRVFDPASQRSVQKTNQIRLFPPEDPLQAKTCAAEYFPPETLIIAESPEQWEPEIAELCSENPEIFRPRVLEGFRGWVARHPRLSLAPAGTAGALPQPFSPVENFTQRFRNFLETARKELKRGSEIRIYSRQAARLREVLEENHLGNIRIYAHPLSEGFAIPSQRLLVFTDHELFGRVIGFMPHRPGVPSAPAALEELQEGRYVVHARHGIALFDGVLPLFVEGKTEDYLALSFAEKDKLYIPLEDMILVERYIGPSDHPPALSKLGAAEWRNARRRAREAAKEIAGDLVRLYAARREIAGQAFPPDTPWQAELEEAFPFIETPDQAKAVRETKQDMESARPMDRLILGDVGYGKTEVALRASFKAVMGGKQAAILVPTTVLAQQHFETFTERLTVFPVRVEVLSRFKSKKEIQTILSALAAGEIDIVIGTHRLLQKDVVFKDIGLLIIDEEQRFGVVHKEALKKMKENVDVLTLSATPIPRTLYFSLSGVRDLSVIETPPMDRLPVKTFVVPREDNLIQQAVLHEIKREGQVYYLYNRIEGLKEKAVQLHRLVPRARIAVAHGKMKPSQLEEIMWEFMKGLYDVLLCTTLIENGLDIPRVNTLIVEEAERYGLADLYQLRGRVGRSDRQAYAYFLTNPRKKANGSARKRLETMEEFTQLGSGCQIALKDLEFRGIGNLLGFSQHGHMARIGFHLYCQILAEEVKKLKQENLSPPAPKVSLEIPISAYIPSDYIESKSQKLDFYRKLIQADTLKAAGDVLAELADRFGPPPEAVVHLIDFVKIKIICRKNGVSRIQFRDSTVKIRFSDGREESAAAGNGGFPVKICLDFLEAKFAVVQKSFRGSDKKNSAPA